jgi:hypothetical protein
MTGKLLLADDSEKVFKAGDVVRFADKDIHGLLNDGDAEYIYISITALPINIVLRSNGLLFSDEIYQAFKVYNKFL